MQFLPSASLLLLATTAHTLSIPSLKSLNLTSLLSPNITISGTDPFSALSTNTTSALSQIRSNNRTDFCRALLDSPSSNPSKSKRSLPLTKRQTFAQLGDTVRDDVTAAMPIPGSDSGYLQDFGGSDWIRENGDKNAGTPSVPRGGGSGAAGGSSKSDPPGVTTSGNGANYNYNPDGDTTSTSTPDGCGGEINTNINISGDHDSSPPPPPAPADDPPTDADDDDVDDAYAIVDPQADPRVHPADTLQDLHKRLYPASGVSAIAAIAAAGIQGGRGIQGTEGVQGYKGTEGNRGNNGWRGYYGQFGSIGRTGKNYGAAKGVEMEMEGDCHCGGEGEGEGGEGGEGEEGGHGGEECGCGGGEGGGEGGLRKRDNIFGDINLNIFQNLSVSYANGNATGTNSTSAYVINGVDVPEELKEFQPGTLREACGTYLDEEGDNTMDEDDKNNE